MRFLEPLRYGYLLRAGFQALIALGALVGALLFTEPIGSAVTEPCGAGVIIYHRFVVHLEDTRDFHTSGTGHTISAIGAGNGAQPAVGFLYATDQCQLIFCEGTRSRAPGGGDVLHHLLHRTHAAENHRGFRVVPDPQQSPLSRGALLWGSRPQPGYVLRGFFAEPSSVVVP